MPFGQKDAMRDIIYERPYEIKKTRLRVCHEFLSNVEECKESRYCAVQDFTKGRTEKSCKVDDVNAAIKVKQQPDDNVCNPHEYFLHSQGVGQDTQTDQSIRYQDIVYYKADGKIKVKDVPIGFIDAVKEMETLPSDGDAFIGFINRRTRELVQFLRNDTDAWYVDVPIDSGKEWDGYYWGVRTDTKGAIDLLRLFFEEAPWFGTLNFTMRRYKHRSR